MLFDLFIQRGRGVVSTGTLIRHDRNVITLSLTPGNSSLELVIEEIPSGAINGTNVIFSTLYNFSSLLVYLNGIRLKSNDDFFITGGNIFSLAYPPQVGDILLVDYLR